MANSPKPSPSVIAAAVVAILGALLTLLSAALGIFTILLRPPASSFKEFPPFVTTCSLVGMAFMFCVAIFGVITGISLIRLRSWARISVLVWAGAWVFFGAFGVLVVLLMGILVTSNLLVDSAWGFRLMLGAIYGAPLAIGIWWLILFTRREIRSQFAHEAPLVALSVAQQEKPRCPVPIAVMAWFYVSSVLNIIILPFLPFRAPALLFGRLIPGAAGTATLLVICLLFTVMGAGILRLKPWSYDLMIGLELFFLTSGIVTALGSNFDSLMRSAIAKMNEAMQLPADTYPVLDPTQLIRWGMYFGLLLTLGILVLLFYYRERFLEAAAAAKT